MLVAALAFLISTFSLSTPLFADIIVDTYDVPENSSGLAWDGNVLWIGGVGNRGGWIRAYDVENEQIVDSIRAPVADCLGLAFINNRLAYLSPRCDTTFFVSQDGYEVGFANPFGNLGGLGADGNTLWSATYSDSPGVVLHLDEFGRILQSMPFSGRHGRDVAFHRERLYVADRLAQEIRIVNPESGRFIRTFDTPTRNPDGLASDGEYLWLLDDGDNKSGDKLYKILITPDGNMRLSSLAHNFGSLVIDDEVNWTLWVYNDGSRTAELINYECDGNDDILTPNMWSFPRTIEPGDSAALDVTFGPAYYDSVFLRFALTYNLDRQAYWIDLRGKGVNPRRDILIRQRQLDFGITLTGQYVNSSNLRYLLVENNGGEPLTIGDLIFSNESFFHGYYNFPHTFDEPGLYRIPIFFRPDRDENIAYHERVTIVNNDPDSPQIIVNLVGTTHLNNYLGGTDLWTTSAGTAEVEMPRIRAIQDIDDISGDGLSDIVIASNDYRIQAFHAAATQYAIPIWTYRTDTNPWRSGVVASPRGLSEGDDWDEDGVKDIALGLEGGSKRVVTLSGRTGEEIWIFDTHNMRDGGGNVVVVRGELDFDGDGIKDIYAAVAAEDEQNSTDALILINGANGRLLWQNSLDNSPVDACAVPDFTGDQTYDLFVLLEGGTVIGVDGNRGRTVWDQRVLGHIRTMFPLLGDANGDGSIDVGFVTQDHGVTLLNGSNGVRLWNHNLHDDLQTGIATNDLNGNGSPDILYGDDNVVRAIDGLGPGVAAPWDSSVIIGSRVASMALIQDFDLDGRMDFLVGTASGRLYAYSGDGYHHLWSLSNVGEGHGFVYCRGVRDIDGNNGMDVFGAMVNGTVFCFAGSYIGNAVPGDYDDVALPNTLIMDPAFPNPFNSMVVVPIYVQQPGRIAINIFNVMGRSVYHSEMLSSSPGRMRVIWRGVGDSGSPLPSGMYYMEVKSSSQRAVRPIELLR